MGDHFLPQLYLRGFTQGELLWAHDKLQKRSFESQPKSVANENNMYPPELEQFLANVVEESAKTALEDARQLRPLAHVQREALASYIVALWKRVPQGRARALGLVPSVVADLRSELNAGIRTAAAGKPQLAQLASEKTAEVDRYLAEYERDRALELWHQTLEGPASQAVVESLMSMEWSFLVDRRRTLVTCDNPVFFFPHEGIGQPLSELTLPLSSSVALWATRRKRSSAGLCLKASPSAARELNRRAAVNAVRFMYTERNEHWMLPFLLQGSYRLTRLV